MEPSTIMDEYTAQGSPRALRYKIDLTSQHCTALVSNVAEMTKTITRLEARIAENVVVIEKQSHELESINAQFKLLVGQFSRLEIARLEEVVKLTQEIALLKKTVHTEMAACRETLTQDVRAYVSALENSERSSNITFDL